MSEPDLGKQVVKERVRGKLFGGVAPTAALRMGRFELGDKLGEGAMGAVYRAYDPELQREVAVKVVRGAARAKATADNSTLLREAQAMARLAHPNVATVHEVGIHDGGVFIAMELVVGPTLREWLAGGHRPMDVLAMVIQAGRGLAAAHQRGLVHRDFKPDNVLVGLDGRARVVDFGLVAVGEAARDGGSVHGGTPRYMSPEQLRGEPCDAASDQFNFCATLYEALVGRPPFEAATREAQLDAIRSGPWAPPRGHAAQFVMPAIRRGLSFERSARFATLGDVLDVLERQSARRTTRGRLVWLVPALAIPAVVVAGWAWWTRTLPVVAPAAKRGVSVGSDGNDDLYARLTQLGQEGKYAECIALIERSPPSLHLANLRVSCALSLGDEESIRAACAEHRRGFPREDAPAECGDTYNRAKALHAAGRHMECIDVAEKGPPSLPLIVQMYSCAGELRDRATFVRVCRYASSHFPKNFPPQNCPKPL